jgi:hypothetical protein
MAGAQWVRLDVGYLTNPKLRRIGERDVLLHLSSILYLGAHGIDSGLLPPEALDLLALSARLRPSNLSPSIERLVKHGLWHPDLSGGFLVHDYRQLNGDESEAAQSRQRMRRYRSRKGGPDA